MRGQIAKVLFERDCARRNVKPMDWELIPAWTRKIYLEDADAVINEMAREMDAMIDKMAEKHYGNRRQAMVIAATSLFASFAFFAAVVLGWLGGVWGS